MPSVCPRTRRASRSNAPVSAWSVQKTRPLSGLAVGVASENSYPKAVKPTKGRNWWKTMEEPTCYERGLLLQRMDRDARLRAPDRLPTIACPSRPHPGDAVRTTGRSHGCGYAPGPWIRLSILLSRLLLGLGRSTNELFQILSEPRGVGQFRDVNAHLLGSSASSARRNCSYCPALDGTAFDPRRIARPRTLPSVTGPPDTEGLQE